MKGTIFSRAKKTTSMQYIPIKNIDWEALGLKHDDLLQITIEKVN